MGRLMGMLAFCILTLWRAVIEGWWMHTSESGSFFSFPYISVTVQFFLMFCALCTHSSSFCDMHSVLLQNISMSRDSDSNL
jgi:hypothetical protein